MLGPSPGDFFSNLQERFVFLMRKGEP